MEDRLFKRLVKQKFDAADPEILEEIMEERIFERFVEHSFEVAVPHVMEERISDRLEEQFPFAPSPVLAIQSISGCHSFVRKRNQRA